MDGEVGTAETADGWATRTLRHSLHHTLVGGTALSQVFMALAVLAVPEAASHRPALLAAHVAGGVVALLCLLERVPVAVTLLVLAPVVLLDFAVADAHDGLLAVAAAWILHLLQLVVSLTALERRARAVLAVIIGYGVPGGVALVHPDWLLTLGFPLLFAGLGIRAGGRLGVRRLEAFAGRVDDELAAAWQERRAAAEDRAAVAAAAEQARTLHDTVINTLAAVASGGGAVRDVDEVRERCGRDVVTVEALVAGRELAVEPRLDNLVAEAGLVARRRGLDDDELAEVAALLPGDVVRALVGAVGEALRNVAKHAGTGEVELTVEHDDSELVVVVADRGRGFDGRLVPGRGLAGSMAARADAAGIGVELSTSPGAGTRIRLACPLGPETGARDALPAPRLDVLASVETIRQQACWLWVAAVVLVGVAIELPSRSVSNPVSFLMLAIVAAVGAVAWWDIRAAGRLRGPTTALVVLSAPATYLLALVSIDFGRGDTVAWHALGVSAPLVILLVQARGRAPFVLGFTASLVAAAAAMALVARSEPLAAAILPVGTAAGLGVAAGWARFHHVLEAVGKRAAEEQRTAAEASVERAAREAAAGARERWRQAGLTRSLALLRRIASATTDPDDPATRAACAEEEAYLRQVSLLDPELFRLGYWLARALAQARARDVRLVVRTGERDVEDAATAAALGRLVLDVVAAAPARSELTVSLFRTHEHLHFGLVGPSAAVAAAWHRWRAPEGWRSTIERYGAVDLVEATSPRSV